MDARHNRDARSVFKGIQISSFALWFVAAISTGLFGQTLAEPTPPPGGSNSPATAAQSEYFESVIRPALHQHCLACHNAKKTNGGLALDSRDGWAKGGDSGSAIVPGKPDESLLIRTIRHVEPGLEMPAKAPKLDESDIAKFSRWIEQGAFDPRETPEPFNSFGAPSNSDAQWESIAAQRAKWWCWQPLPSLPITPDISVRGSQAIDAWIARKLSEQSLPASPKADRRTLIRRLSFQLRGIPPSQTEVDAFLDDPSDNAWTKVVDAMLSTDEFAEHWARHWLDTVRYAETHGSEDDAYLPFAYRYRDYIVRAFRDDVPIHRLILENLAGDLVEPRWNEAEGINESLIGLGFYRFVEFNQTPVDVKREEIVVIDSQIEAIGKAFQGITISCARCHDHKFDPISDEDYYAIYGILRSTRSGLPIIDRPFPFSQTVEQLSKLQQRVRTLTASEWDRDVSSWPSQIERAIQEIQTHWTPDTKWEELEKRIPNDRWTRAIGKWVCKPSESKLAPLGQLLIAKNPSDCEQHSIAWEQSIRNESAPRELPPDTTTLLFDLTSQNAGTNASKTQTLENWRIQGSGMPTSLIDATTHWSILGSAADPFSILMGPGYHTNLYSDRASGSLRSPDFIVDGEAISILCRGTGNARVRLVMENFQGDSLLFDTVNPSLNSNSYQWITMTIRPQWRGLRAHLEFLTRDAKPYIGIVKDPNTINASDGRSSFGVAKAIMHSRGLKLQPPNAIPVELVESQPRSTSAWIEAILTLTSLAIDRMERDEPRQSDIDWLNALISSGLLQSNIDSSPDRKQLAADYRAIESQIPIPKRTPGVFEDNLARDQEWLSRGDHKQPRTPVARRYLKVLGSSDSEYQSSQSGRLMLANEIVSSTNPLTARVYVNRAWNWLFGEGLVRTVDNFGRMGESPSHPELLDQLSVEFMENGWSNKQLLRAILTSETWQRSSLESPIAREKDPGNRLWSHASVRRLDAESIRDTMLYVAGNLKRPDGGLGTANYYRQVLEPNKQSPPGPIDGNGRRSLYLEVRRNFPNEFLLAFDFPRPAAPIGKRSSTIVPTQSLALMNDPFVIQQSKVWAARVAKMNTSDAARINAMYQSLLNRLPSDQELASAEQLIQELATTNPSELAWSTLAHAMFNLKESIFIR
ncbi:MAG: DUF1553 domain-containing protein [Pirellula sp.]